jgi:hypothetical protein
MTSIDSLAKAVNDVVWQLNEIARIRSGQKFHVDKSGQLHVDDSSALRRRIFRDGVACTAQALCDITVTVGSLCLQAGEAGDECINARLGEAIIPATVGIECLLGTYSREWPPESLQDDKSFTKIASCMRVLQHHHRCFVETCVASKIDGVPMANPCHSEAAPTIHVVAAACTWRDVLQIQTCVSCMAIEGVVAPSQLSPAAYASASPLSAASTSSSLLSSSSSSSLTSTTCMTPMKHTAVPEQHLQLRQQHASVMLSSSTTSAAFVTKPKKPSVRFVSTF